ncbi:MAG: sugar porter family MFS transporter [Planctomycetota bacterium]
MTETNSTGASDAFAFRVAFVAAIGGFLFGFDLGMIAAANVYLRDQFQLSDAAFGFATASAVLGCILGPFLGSWLCDAVGRKRTMICASLLLAISAVFTAVPDAFGASSNESIMRTFNFFRFVGGLGVGLCSVASPMYIAELAPAERRGRLGMMYQLAIVVGHVIAPLIAFAVIKILSSGYGVTDDVIPENPWLQAWRWMFFSETVCVAAFVLFVFALPNSPRWLAEKGRFDEAEQVLAQVAGAEHARSEIEEIKVSLNEEEGSWAELFSPGMRFAVLIGILLTFFNNWTGWSVIGGYVPRLFELAGFGREAGIRNFVFVYGAMGSLTLVSLMLTDRIGRRPLWIGASLAMAIITAVTGYLFHHEVTGWPVLVILMLVTIPHGIALGGLPWLMMSELFPTRLRAKAVSVTTTTLWCFIFAGASLFPMITGTAQQNVLTARNVKMTSDQVSFVDADPARIEIAVGDLASAGFRPLDQVTVIGASQASNNGSYLISEVSEGQIVLSGSSQLATEAAGASVTLQVGSVGPAFWIFTVVCVLSLLFGLTIMPETKGRTLEEIGSSWKK